MNGTYEAKANELSDRLAAFGLSCVRPDALPGELIVAILAGQGYQLRDDDTSHGRVGFVTHRYGKGHWQLVDFEDEAGYAKWVWDSDDHELINVELPEAWF